MHGCGSSVAYNMYTSSHCCRFKHLQYQVVGILDQYQLQVVGNFDHDRLCSLVAVIAGI